MDVSSIINRLRLSSKLENVGDKLKSKKNQQNLTAIVDDNLIIWSPKDCCFYSQNLVQDNANIQVSFVLRNNKFLKFKCKVNYIV